MGMCFAKAAQVDNLIPFDNCQGGARNVITAHLLFDVGVDCRIGSSLSGRFWRSRP